MKIDNIKVVNILKEEFKLKDDPIAFFYTNDPPEEVYKPARRSIDFIPCIIQFLNGVRKGKTLVLGKESKNLCPGGQAYLGFRKRMEGLENFLSRGIPNPNGEGYQREGERFIKTPELAKAFFEQIPFRKHPADYAVFMPLVKVDMEKYTPLLVIFHVTMDQLAGLTQLANYETVNRVKLGIGSGCSTIITEPLAELEKSDDPAPIAGMLTDILARRHIKSEEATFTISYQKLLKLVGNIEESFVKLEAWEHIRNRIS